MASHTRPRPTPGVADSRSPRVNFWKIRRSAPAPRRGHCRRPRCAVPCPARSRPAGWRCRPACTGRVFQQVAEHALDQHAVAFHQRQLGQAGHRHLVRGQWFAHGRQRRAHQFLYRLPFQPQRRVAALQPGHVQWLATSACMLGLVAHRADGVLHIGRQRGLLACQRVGHADQAGQRRAQVVRHRGKQRVAQLLGFHADQRLLRHLDIMQALERDGDQRGVGFDLTPRFGIGEQAAARRGQRQDAAGAHGAFSGR